MSGRNVYFLTTPIFYVNAAPHIGHLYSALIADVVHRLKRLDGYGHTIFSTGTDEHGTKIQEAAKKNKQTLKDYCDGMSLCYRTTFEKYNVDFTDFIRTTDDHHKKAVHHFWDCIKEKGYIYQGKYAGWYCTSEESFLGEGQLIEKSGPDGKLGKVSAESGHPVEWTEEENFMFRLSSFKNDLLHWLLDERVVQPLKFHKQLVSWVQDDSLLQDISISRSKERVHWGIPVPDNSDQTIYVWLEALVNYLSVVGYPHNQFQEFWPPDVQVIGKDILKFHGIYWPAFLMAADLEPPKTLLCHSHWTVNQEKMSKSKNNIVDPHDMLQTYGSSGFRYFLLREGTPHSDANFSATKVKNILNSELADSLGNLLNRCCSRSVNPKQIFPVHNHDNFAKYCESDAEKLITHLTTLPDAVRQHFEAFNFYKGIDAIIASIHVANKFFENQKPWILAKSLETSDHLEVVLNVTMETLRVCGILLQPVVPELSDILLSKLNIPNSQRMWKHIKPFSWEQAGEKHLCNISEVPAVLYQRIQKK